VPVSEPHPWECGIALGAWARRGRPYTLGCIIPAAKVAVAVFVVIDPILAYGLTVNDSPIRSLGVPAETGASSARATNVEELRKALADFDELVSDIKLFGKDSSRDPRHSTSRSA
jgi:hypothetical protein